MRYIIFKISLLLALNNSFAQDKLRNFEINGKVIGSKQIDYFRLSIGYKSKNGILIESDSIPVYHGNFKITGKVAYPHAVHIFYDDSDTYFSTKLFFIERGIQYLSINTDSIHDFTPRIEGSKTHDFYLRNFLSNEVIDLEKNINKFTDTFKITEESRIIYSQLKNNFYDERDKALLNSSIKHKGTIIPAWILLNYMHRSGYNFRYFDIFNNLNRRYKKTDLGKYLYDKISLGSKVDIGLDFPELRLLNEDLNPKKTKIVNTSKTYTLIDFWFGKCSPCIAQFPAFKELYEKYGEENLEIITISIDREKDIPVWRDVIKNFELPWVQYLDLGGVEAQKLSINSYPTNFLLDKSGKIIAKNIELVELKKLLATKANSNE
jgi:thiol-disulfide isomerase/thioredoxin